MKRYLLFIILLIAFVLYADVETIDAVGESLDTTIESFVESLDVAVKPPVSYSLKDNLEMGVESYLRDDFTAALEYLSQVEQAGLKTPDLYYHIGNTHYRLKDIPMAIVYYKRALLLDSSHKPAKENLDFVLSRTSESQINADDNYSKVLWQNIIYFFSINTLLIICLVITSLVVLLVHLQWIMVDKDKTLLRFMSFVLISILLLFVVLTAMRISLSYSDEAVIAQNSVVIRSGPGDSRGEIRTVNAGTIIKIYETEGDWSRIVTLNGTSGWIKSDVYIRIRN